MKGPLFRVNLPVLFYFSLLCFPYINSYSQTTESKRDTLAKSLSNQPVYYTKRLSTARPVIDGKLDDECWKTGEWAGDFTQYMPNEGAKPSYPTEMMILYDDKYIYAALRGYDGEPGKMQRIAGSRDEFAGDIMGVNFDSYHDHRTGFEFSITSWGQKIDLILFNPENWDFNWNAVWNGKTGVEDSAWVAEIEVPLSQLRYSKKDEQVWGLHVWRWINRYQEESDWEVQSKTGPGVMYNFGELRGIKGLKKSQRLEIMPYTLGELNTMQKEPGNPFNEKGKTFSGNLGLDAKIGVSSNFTVDVTINPDFGQVESDPSVMNLTAFETFYEEKRPFFLEGLTIFNYKFDNQNLFYSRRIGHSPSLEIEPDGGYYVKSPDKTSILSAVKFSGTTSNGLSVGVIQSVTANEYAKLSDSEGNMSSKLVEPMTNYMVGRVQQGYKEGNTVIGGIVTSANRFIDDPSLEFLAKNAYTGGFDLLHHWRDKEFFLDARLIGSYVNGETEAITALQESSARYYQRPGADYLDYDTSRTSLSGYGGKIHIGKGSKGFWRYSTAVTWLSPGLELNDLGYMNRADNINNENEIGYFVNKPVSIFRTYRINLEQFNTWNFNGTYLGSGNHLAFLSEFKNQWAFDANFIYHSNPNDTKILRGGYDMKMPFNYNVFGNLRTDYSKKVMLGINYEYNFTACNSASGYSINPGITVRPLNNLKIRVSGNYEDNFNDLQYVAERAFQNEARYILARIDQKTVGMTFRVDLNLTPEFSVQYYGSPFISTGTYTEFKKVTDPQADDYSERFELYDNVTVTEGNYYFDDDGDGINDYSVENPDFNFHQFRSNFVAKWEYRPGSFLYFVWSQDKTGNNSISDASFKESYDMLHDTYPNNIFLVKLSYWFSL